jgi:hypothetical protein
VFQALEEVVERQTPPHGSHDQGQRRASAIDRLGRELRSRWPEWITISLYAALVAFAIPYHEPWSDEAQSWQLARSLPLHALFQTYIRYEGSPGLWHFLLWCLIRAHVSYAGMHWVCGAIAVAAASLLIWKSPFPRYLRFLLPFTYFLLFQYAVVARSYVLAPVLLFMIALWWKKSPLLVALLLGLLANVALHTAVISGGLAAVYGIELVRDGRARRIELRRGLVWGAVILLGFYAFAMWTAWPPHDLQAHISAVRGQSRPFLACAVASIAFGICEPWMLSIPFWIAIALCLHARRGLFYLLPVLGFALFSGVVYATFWHAGLLVPLVISLLWISWPATEHATSRYETIARAALMLMVGTQILWAGYAIAYDHSNAYSPDLAAAKFLKPFAENGAPIAVTYLEEPEGREAFQAVGILPYFDRNIYLNLPDTFWRWSADNPTESLFPAALRFRPQIVLVEEAPTVDAGPFPMQAPKVRLLEGDGYRLTNVFCGAKPLRLQLETRTCHLIFQLRPDQAANE